MNSKELNAKLKVLLESKPKAISKAKVVKATELKGETLEQKETEILKRVAEISRKKDRNFSLISVFYRGMKYTDKEGKERVALTDGFRYKDTNKKGVSYIGTWRV